MGPTGPHVSASFFDDIDAAGIPFAYKITDNAPDNAVIAIARQSPIEHTIIYRRSVGIHGTVGVYDVPDYSLTPYLAAVKHWRLHVGEFPAEVKQNKDLVWVETINEVDKNRAEWLAEFARYTAGLAWEDGYKWLAFGWSGGEPEPEHWRGTNMQEFLRLCADNRHRVGVALHEYSMNKNIWNGRAADGSMWLVGRYTHLLQACGDLGIGYPRIDITEWGWGRDKNTLPPQSQRKIDYASVMELYANAPIHSAAIWCLNSGEWGGIDLEIQKDIGWIKDFILTTKYDVDQIEPPPEKHKAIVVKLPQDATPDEMLTAVDQAFEYRHTFTQSHDDTMTLLRGGNADSFVKFSHPERDAETIALVEAAGYTWQPLYSQPNWTILPIPHLTQVGNVRSNDCGAACAAMIARLAGKTPTVDEVAIKYQIPANSYMHFNQLDTALNGYGMDGSHQRPFYAADVDMAIKGYGEPVICLVHYPALPQRFSAFSGAHFIVAYGTDGENILYRDPLQVAETRLEMSLAELDAAMAQAVKDGNMAYQGMVCRVKDTPVPTGETVNVLSYQMAHPAAFRVVYNGQHGEDVQDMALPGGAWVRRKGNNAEWWQQDEDYAYLVHDTSPTNVNGRSVCYTIYKNDKAGYSPKNPETMKVGQAWKETGSHFVQFRYKDNCEKITTPPTGNAQNACTLLWRNKAYKFPKMPVTLDVIALMTTNNEIQLYAKTNAESAAHYSAPEGLAVGWVGWDAAWGEANIEELYFDRGVMKQEPERYCNWE